MEMVKRVSVILALLALALFAFRETMQAQQAPAPATKAAEPKKAESKPAEKPTAKSKEWKIQNAMSAGPRSIAKGATVLDWPEKEGGELAVLRKGANEWTCFPDWPVSPGSDPSCYDKASMEWLQAWIAKKEPKLSQPGIGYMVQGGSEASNTDPFATKPAAGEKWIKTPPHIMVFPAGKLDPKVYGTDPHTGRPWIMFPGTPYEHLMIPVK